MSVYRRDRIYWFNFVFNGKLIQQSTKQGNRKAALEICAAFRTSLAKGEVGIAPKKKELRTIGELLGMLSSQFEQNGQLSPQNRSLLKRAKEDFGSKLATELTGEHVEKYVERRKAEGARNASINRVTEVLRQAYKVGRVRIPEMPPALSEKDNVRKGFFSEVQLDSLLANLPEDLQDFTRFAAFTGMRKGELASLTWSRIEGDAHGDALCVPGELTKNGEDRVLPLAGELAAIIERRKAARVSEKDGTVQLSEFIFNRSGRAIAEMRKSWHSAAIACGLGTMVCKKCGARGPKKYCCGRATRYEGRLFHDLRRMAVRNLVRCGTARKGCRHRKIKFPRYSFHYIRELGEKLRDAHY